MLSCFPMVRLRNAVENNGRIIGGPFGSDLTSDDYVTSGVPVIRVTNQVGTIVGGEYVYVTNEKAKKLAANIARPGDIVVVQRGSTYGKVSKIPENADYPEYVVCQSQMAISVDENTLSRDFLFQALLSSFFHRHIESSVIQTGQPHINLGILRDAKIPLPPLPEQRRIAEILQTWDEAIEKLEALRAEKERRRDALTFSMVFGARQLMNFEDQGQARKHRWFDLPAPWDCKTVGEIAKEVSERNGDGEHEVLSCSKYEGFVRSLEYFNKQVFSSDLSGYKVIRRGEFGFPSNHVEEGSIGLQNLVDTGLVSPIYTVFRFNPDFIDNDFAFAVLKTSLYRHIFEVSTSASVDRRGSLRWSEFSKIPFPIPPLEEQRAIMGVIRTARADAESTAREITALQCQKRGLMQKLLTGEWRVNGISEGANG